MTFSSKGSLPDRPTVTQPFSGGGKAAAERPNREPIAWFQPHRAGELAAVVRAERDPIYRSESPYSPADDTYAIRIDISQVIPGDRFGEWTVLSISRTVSRRHGWPCHCIWDMHAQLGSYSECGYDNPECPCYYFSPYYTAICRCICGTVKPVSTASLVTARSLSCGHCACKCSPCTCEVRHAS